jgi:hypothetical protein
MGSTPLMVYQKDSSRNNSHIFVIAQTKKGIIHLHNNSITLSNSLVICVCHPVLMVVRLADWVAILIALIVLVIVMQTKLQGTLIPRRRNFEKPRNLPCRLFY